MGEGDFLRWIASYREVREGLEETTCFRTRAGNISMNSFQPSYDTAKGPEEIHFPVVELLTHLPLNHWMWYMIISLHSHEAQYL